MDKIKKGGLKCAQRKKKGKKKSNRKTKRNVCWRSECKICCSDKGTVKTIMKRIFKKGKFKNTGAVLKENLTFALKAVWPCTFISNSDHFI